MQDKHVNEGICVKVHRQSGHVLVAACDSELVGSTLEHSGQQIEVRISFYGETRYGETDLVRALSVCTMANLLGQRAVKVAIDHDMVDKETVSLLGGIPHAQIYRL